MKKKQLITYALIAASLAALAYWQVHSWSRFDWPLFFSVTHDLHWGFVLLGVAVIYGDYFLRAWRWKIMLEPVRKVNIGSVTAAQFIGFTGLALLGRPGELIRPYLIARRHGLSMSSQMAVWTVERIFDFGSFTIILVAANLLFGNELQGLPYYKTFHHVGIPLIATAVLMIAVFAFILRRFGRRVAGLVERTFGGFAPNLAKSLEAKVFAYAEGLNTIRSFASFVQLSVLSLVIWMVIALAYWLVTHAYPTAALQLPVPSVTLLMGFSVAGGVAQLPVVGGGSQFATITAMKYVFLAKTVADEGVRNSLAVSCGILLWLVTFMAVIPAGLALAHRAHISITRVANEEQGASA